MKARNAANWIVPGLLVGALVMVFTMVIVGERYTDKWHATIRYQDGQVVEQDFMIKMGNRPHPESDNGSYLLRIADQNGEVGHNYISVPGTARIEFRFVGRK